MVSRPVRLTAFVALAVLAAPLLASCSSLQLAFGSTTSAAYGSIDEFRTDTTLPAPSWVPDDATDIRYTTDLADDSSILTYRSASHFASGACDTDARTPNVSESEIVAEAPLEDTWWPETLPATLVTCDAGWTAFVDGDVVYGFTPGASDSPTQGSSGVGATSENPPSLP
ncbi:hypothetical protein ELQ92_06485 [Labedella populi]|uniref:Uncharacterized protein n=1 Tax=Labedella populi TaxID=2498850 RepID=A0A3S3ZWH8_9MICO|nr:hypothetical protein [Labedella populi]RWZ64411.1 hypothetical protein ELQ92_06485 [Labedella populi]